MSTPSVISTRFSARNLRRWLAGPADRAHGREVFRAQARRFTVAQTLVWGFYAFLLYYAATEFRELPRLLSQAPNAKLWPVVWLRWTGFAPGVRVLLGFYLATNLAGVFTAPWRAGRLLTFLGLLEYVALNNSFGKIGHSWHLPLLVAGVFVLLPGGWSRPAVQIDRRRRQETLLVFWLAQAVVLLSYTMSGAAKFAVALYQLATGQANAFSPGSLSAIIAQRLLETHTTSFFGPWIIRHPYLTWPAFPAAICLEMFAVVAAFRPALVRPWAGALMAFHFGIFFSMGILFPQSCFLLALLLFPSPFEPEPAPTWQERFFALPWVHSLYKYGQATVRKRAVSTRNDFAQRRVPAADPPGGRRLI